MSDEEKIKLAKDATRHALNAICDDPRKYWLLGVGTGTWEKLTAAHAALWDLDVEKVRAGFRPNRERYEAEERLLDYCRNNGITGGRA